MDHAYWIRRKRASLRLARSAATAQARLIHYDLAGRYSVNAMSAETSAIDLAGSLPQRISAETDND